MGKIVILDELTANKIAAGEVIERPSSVVKELVENSIDSGAKNITIEIKNGGILKIKVVDDGCGILEDDILIAFERHATSKIRRAEDLETIVTMGFRGEALSSIAGVSKVELLSRTKDSDYGRYVEIAGGDVIKSEKKGCPFGTTIIVNNLFFNVPARYKFLKKDSTEASHITDIIERLALGYSNISFKLIGNKSIILNTPGNGDLASAIHSIYGKEIFNNCSLIKNEIGNIVVTGYIGNSSTVRSNRNNQTVFLNKRYIKSKVITAAIDEACKTFIMKGKHPFALINIEINSTLVDVNVHPTKMEIRFQNEGEVFKCVYGAIKGSIEKNQSINEVNFVSENENIKKETKKISKNEIINNNININEFEISQLKNIDKDKKILNSFFENKVKSEEKNIELNNRIEKVLDLKPQKIDKDKIFDKIINSKDENKLNINDESKLNINDEKKLNLKEENDYFDNNQNTVFNEEIKNIDKTESEINESKVLENEYSKEKLRSNNLFDNYEVIGQIFSTYIVIEVSQNVYLIDQHAAHERIMYEELKESYSLKKMSQLILEPIVIKLNSREMEFVFENIEFFNEIGFYFDNFGRDSIILRSIPIKKNTRMMEMFLEILDFTINSYNKDKIASIADEVLFMIACKSAVKANKKMDNVEINKLISDLNKIKNPFTCPHGRPVILKLTKLELEKLFKRVL